MSEAAVQTILHDNLSDDERLALDRELAKRLEREWSQEASAARQEAARRGITQADIDRAVERERYGR